eukprot:SM000024S07837  [mRNA]  locus=s24:828308:834278:+ [translate_table: standard]
MDDAIELSDDGGGGGGGGDPRLRDELEGELQAVEAELLGLQETLDGLFAEQDRLLQRRDAIAEALAATAGSPSGPAPPRKATAAAAAKQEPASADLAGAFPWDADVERARKDLFGISAFRPHQREIINAVLDKRDVFVIMPAGGGKSLCYQLPAAMSNGLTLVVSPLLSLIQDQVMGLTALGIAAAMLTSTTTKAEVAAIYSALEKDEGQLRLLYVTPEKVAKSKSLISKLEKCNHAGRLSLIAIDEAHCCSQWGHDFRPDYKNLGVLKTQFPKVPMMALTATATGRVQADVRAMLRMLQCEIFISSVNRPNLYYEVLEKSSTASAVIDDIAAFIKHLYPGKQSGIVYCFSRRECEQVARELVRRNIKAAHYHADMDAEDRTSVHCRWSGNIIQVIVGTVAFGMGINKPDVRFVIHHSLSKSIETYYQESGRAGRDGLPSRCAIFFRPADLPRQSSMVFAEAAGLHNLYSMGRFCQVEATLIVFKAIDSCRRHAIYKHFGEEASHCNYMCDNCAEPKDIIKEDVTEQVRALLECIKKLNEVNKQLTMLQLVDHWRSSIRKLGGASDGGKLVKPLSKESVELLIVKLVLQGVLKDVFQHTAYATNVYVGWGNAALCSMILKGRRSVFLETVRSKGGAGVPRVKGQHLQSVLEQRLDAVRQQAAIREGVFPHSVLPTELMLHLCSAKPSDLEQLTEIVGVRKAEKYGAEILAALAQSDDLEGEALGKWTTPKSPEVPVIAPRARTGENSGRRRTKSANQAPSEKPSAQHASRTRKGAKKARAVARNEGVGGDMKEDSFSDGLTGPHLAEKAKPSLSNGG